MSLLQWNDALMVGHPQIDSEHKKLVEILNRLYDAMQSGKGKDVCGSILNDLVAYTKSHFAAEERLMAMHGYAQAADHKGQHARLVREVLDFKSKFDAGSTTLTVALFRFLKEWLSNHILGSDRALVAALKPR